MHTRRTFLKNSFGAGSALALGLPGARWASAQSSTEEEESNKATARLFKESQGTPEHADVLTEIMSPNYNRLRGGFYNLARNAADQNFPGPGQYLRGAFPDRHDAIEDIIADGDMVGMLFRITGTHRGNFFGIPPTGKTIDLYEAGIFKLADGRITEAWFMADEAALLKQLGARLPERKDGRLIPPPVSDEGEFGDEALARLMATSPTSQELRNKITVVRTKAPLPPPDLRAPDYVRLRAGFEHLGAYGRAHGVGDQGIGQAFPDRRDRVDQVLAEENKVWMLFRLNGTNANSLYNLPPSNSRVQVPELGRMTFVDGQWKNGWYFGDELGMLLQLGRPNLLVD
jgi:predicted ester cyclase